MEMEVGQVPREEEFHERERKIEKRESRREE
jgi:hypothetical protein